MTFDQWLLAHGHDPRRLTPTQRAMLHLAYEAERPKSVTTRGGPALGIKAASAITPAMRFVGGAIELKAEKDCAKASKSKDDDEEDEDDPELEAGSEEHEGPTRGAKDGESDDGEVDSELEDDDEVDSELEAGAALPTFTMVAYTGGAMKPMGWGLPVVIDLESVIVAKQELPVPYGHDLYDPDNMVGHTTAIKVTTGATGQITAQGVVSGVGKRAEQVRGMVKNKFPFQASLGADPGRLNFIEDGIYVTVNDREFLGPIYVSRNTLVGETSFVPLGADTNTSVSMAASQGKGRNMSFSQWLQARGKEESKLTAEERASLLAAFQHEIGFDPVNPTITGGGRITPSEIQAQAEALAKATKDAGRLAAANELDRQTAIKALCAKATLPASFEFEEGGVKITITNLEAHAVRHDWTPDKTELVALRNGRTGTAPDGQISAGVPSFFVPSKPETGPAVLEAALLQAGRCRLLDEDFYTERDERSGRTHLRAGFSGPERKRLAAQMNARYTDQVQQYAHDNFKGRIGLHQLFHAAAQMNGFRIGEVIRDNDDLEKALHAAFHRRIQADGSSMASLSNVLANVMNKFMLQGYWMVEMAWKEIAGIRPTKDFKPTKSVNLWGDMEFLDLAPDDELQHGTISDQAFANQVATTGRMAIIPRTHLINDDLGVLTSMPMIVGRGGGLKLNKQFWTKYLNPGKDEGGSTDFFAATHTITGQTHKSNYSSGGGSALSSAGLTAAELLFDNQTDPNGDPLSIEAEILLFPPDLKVTAWELLNSEFIVYGGGSAAKQPSKNRFVGAYRPVMSRYLNKTDAPYTNGSTTRWDLLADPGVMAVIEVAFLGGQETPTVQTVQADFNRLGIALRGFFDHGTNMQNSRGGVKSAGS